MTNPILVLGASGNLGGEVVKQLADVGANIRAAARKSSNTDLIKAAGAQFVELDVNNPQTFVAVFQDVEKLFMLTPLVPNMVEAAKILLSAAKEAGVKYIVRQSALGAGVEPGITFARWHREVEKMIEASGIAYTFLRPTPFMQNYANSFGHSIKNTSTFSMPLGDGKVSLVDIRDIAAVAVAALTENGHQGKAYEITGPEAISNYDVAEILSEIAGKTIRYIDISEDAAREQMKAEKMPELIIDGLMELYGVQKAGQIKLVSSAVEKVTGRKPISFRQFALDYAEAFR